jgi:hypothetical protein
MIGDPIPLVFFVAFALGVMVGAYAAQRLYERRTAAAARRLDNVLDEMGAMNPWTDHPTPQETHDARQRWEATLSLHQGDSLGEAAAGRCSAAELREEWQRLGRTRRNR